MKKQLYYYKEKYQLSAPHSEVQELLHLLPEAKNITHPLLDLGCGRGRNSLFLADHDYTIVSVDQNTDALSMLEHILQEEQQKYITTASYDINSATLSPETYHSIMATVVFMFLDPKKIPQIIANMQKATISGGYNLIVVAMDTISYPCRMPFSSPFKEEQLRKYYDEWNIKKYNENIGTLHKKDAQGNPIELQFATIIAQKP